MTTPHLLLLLLPFLAVTSSWSQSSNIKISAKNAWVADIDFDKSATPAVGQESSYYYLLVDNQENFVIQENFIHYAYKILTTEGVQEMSDLSFEFDPSYEKLIFHKVSIHRNGTIITQLPIKIQTIQREQSMDRFLYDGTLTAVINLTDVRIGDIVEYSFTRKGYNPIYEGYINRKLYLNNAFAFEKAYQKVILPANNTFSFKYANTTREPQIKNEGDKISYTWSSNRVPAFVSDTNEPNWYNPYEHVFISNFKSWSEVIAWASKNFYVSDHKQILTELSSKFTGATTEAYALQATRFVQDEIRYLGFESGLNSHKPHAPTKVYDQRFGDCKDKSLLLVTLLRVKGIEAYPVLINTTYRDKIADQLPSANAFDHCIVQMKLNDKLIYIDPTINNQGGDIFTNYFPNYGKGLVVNTNLTGLTDIPRITGASTSEIQTFDMAPSGGEAKLKVKTIYTGAEADDQRSYFSRNNTEEIQKEYLTYYGNLYPTIEKFETLKIRDNRDSNIFVVEEMYRIPKIWNHNDTEDATIFCDFYPQSLEGYLNVSKSSQRTAPYSISYPVNHFHEIHVNILEDWAINTEDTKIEGDYYEYERKVDYENRHLSIKAHYITKGSYIPIEGFSKFVADHDKMLNNLNLRIAVNQTSIKAQSNKWPGIITGLLTIGVGAWFVLWLYRNYDPQPYYPAAWGKPIGGWLILVGFGITLTPVYLLHSLYETSDVITGKSWLIMWYSKNYYLFLYLLLLQIYNIGYVLFSILVLVLFYQRRSSVPKLISIFYGVACVTTILNTVIALQIDPNVVPDKREIIRCIAAAAIWIPYFHMSNRVKRTFVNAYHDDGDTENSSLSPVAVEV